VRFEALLFEAALAPFAKSLGFFGELAAGAGALALARASHDALGGRLERAIEAEDGAGRLRASAP